MENQQAERVLLFIPTYRCQAQIVRVLSKLDRANTSALWEILVVDNCSPDGTVAAAVEFAKSHPHLPLRIVQNVDNFGLGGSHKSAFSYAIEAEFDYVIVLHGDDQGSFEDIVPALEAGLHRKFDAVLGARFMPGAAIEGYSALRNFGNRLFNWLFGLVVGRPIFDLGSGLNIYAVSGLKDRFWLKFADGLTFNYFMILEQCVRRQNLLFVPISWREEDQISNVRFFPQIAQIVKILVGFALERSKFLGREHREVSRQSYLFETIHTTSAVLDCNDET